MDLARYSELKAAGKVHLLYENERLYLVATRYDEWTGEPIREKTEEIRREQILRIKEKLQDHWNSLNELITDAQALIGG